MRDFVFVGANGSPWSFNVMVKRRSAAVTVAALPCVTLQWARHVVTSRLVPPAPKPAK